MIEEIETKTMNPENFELIWNFILANEGQEFQTINGLGFTYQVIGNSIQVVGNRPYKLTMGNFLAACPFFDPDDLGVLPLFIVGRSYVWGIFNGIQDQIGELENN